MWTKVVSEDNERARWRMDFGSCSKQRTIFYVSNKVGTVIRDRKVDTLVCRRIRRRCRRRRRRRRRRCRRRRCRRRHRRWRHHGNQRYRLRLLLNLNVVVAIYLRVPRRVADEIVTAKGGLHLLAAHVTDMDAS